MLQTTLSTWLLASGNFAVSSLMVAVLALLVFSYLVSILQPASAKKADGSPPQLRLPAGKIIQSFFDTQFTFMNDSFKATSSSIFQFKLFSNEVIAISGDEARRSFFREKGLNLYEGFQVLIGTIPTGLDPHQLNSIYKRLSVLQRPDNLQFLIPQLLLDCQRRMDAWGSQAILNPCSAIHNVTFQMTIRAVSSFDVADNSALVSRLKRLYDIIDSSFKPFLITFPWLPGPSTFHKIWASKGVYSIFKESVDARKSSGIRREDALQQLLDSGESTGTIVGFMMGLPIAGARSTGTIGTWLIMFLSSEPYWSSAVRKEIQALISTYASLLSPSLSAQDILPALSAIPLAAWESQTPHLDRCIRETLRRAQPHTAVRKNVGPAFTIGSYTIPSGSFVLYPFSDTLLNPAYYPDPLRWNPARSVHGEGMFLGWGGGKHMCKGQRLATLIMKLMAAYAFLRFDMTTVDEEGERMESQPIPDWDDFLTCRPQEKCSIKVTERSFVFDA